MVLKRTVRAIVLGLLGGAAIATAGDQAKPAPPAATPAATPQAPPPSLEEFVPSEKVRADQAVAFPVDI